MTILCRSLDAHPATRFAALRGDSDPVPLREKLNDLPEPIAKIGSAAGVAFSIVLMIYFVQLGTGETEQ